MEDISPLASIRQRFTAKGLSWWPVLIFLPARTVFAFLTQALTAALAALLGSKDPLREAASWWPVSSTVTDVLCLVSLWWLTRREGIVLADLLGAKGKAALRQLAWIPAVLLIAAPAVFVANAVTQSFYGTWQTPLFTVVDLPLAGAVYSLVVWPVFWVLAEELGYLGYLFPRLEVLSGKAWISALLVIFFWGLQHIAIPFLADATYLQWRVLSAWAATGGMTLAFLFLRRRLISVIGAHYLFDLSTGFLVGLLPLLSR